MLFEVVVLLTVLVCFGYSITSSCNIFNRLLMIMDPRVKARPEPQTGLAWLWVGIET